MATFSAEQFQELLQTFKDAIARGAEKTEKPPGLGQHRRRMIAKDFNIDKFEGSMEKWDDWAFAFRRTVRSMSSECYSMMMGAEKMASTSAPKEKRK